jgi:hypothetical protein
MMTPIHTSWSVLSWFRYDADPPAVPTRTMTTPDGQTWEFQESMSQEWARVHMRRGAEIHDHDRNVTYRATVDPETGDLDHLEVIVKGWIDDNTMRRVPVNRIRREVLKHVAADAEARAQEGEEVITMTLPGGLADPADRGIVPPLEEIADLMSRYGLGRQELAARYGRPVRTVDGWIRRARQTVPERIPPPKQGRHKASNKPSDKQAPPRERNQK